MILDSEFTDLIEVEQIVVDGVATEVLVAGEGPPLVLVHGDGDNASVWQWVMPGLARDHRVYALCLPGHSDVDKAAIKVTREYLRDFVGATIDALELERPAIIGNSIGGQVTLWLALAAPERFSAIILLDSSGLGRVCNPSLAIESAPMIGEMAIAAARSPGGGAMRAGIRAAQLLWRPHGAPKSWYKEQRRMALMPGFLEASVAAKRAVVGPVGQREVLLDRLAQITTPTLVVWGAGDKVLPVTHARKAVERLPNAELAVLHGCGHVAQVECPEALLDVVLPFLGRHRVDETPLAATTAASGS